MINVIEDYNKLLSELFEYYKDIYKIMKKEFHSFTNDKKLKIDFLSDFVISKEKQDGFIKYDSVINKFKLSILDGTNKYNELNNKSILKGIAVKQKYDNNYYDYFNTDEISLLIKFYSISFKECIKSEFFREYVNKILDIKSTSEYRYSDDYGIYIEKTGFAFNDILIEAETRLISKKYDLFYLPHSIGDNNIIRVARSILLDNENKKIIINDYLDTLLDKLPFFLKKDIYKYEENEFTKKYKLKDNIFELVWEEAIEYRSVKQRKKELLDKLLDVKNQFINGRESFGFINIIYIAITLIFICIIYILVLWFRG